MYFVKQLAGKPLLAFRLAKAAMKIIFKNDYFLTAIILPSFKCNLRCEHCFAESLKNPDKKEMTPEQIEEVISKLYKHGIFQFEFQGGEPLLLKELPRYIKACRPNRSIISVTTNSILLNEKNVKMLKELKVDSIHISLDSMDPEEHDTFRGRKGLFDEVMKSVKLVKRYGFKYTFQVTISHQNIHTEGIRKLIEYSIQNEIPIWIFVAQVSGKWIDQNDLLLTEEDRQYLRGLHDKYPKLINRDLWNWFGHYSCPAAKLSVVVTSYGDVLPCAFIQISYGNLLKDSVKDIHEKIGITGSPAKEQVQQESGTKLLETDDDD